MPPGYLQCAINFTIPESATVARLFGKLRNFWTAKFVPLSLSLSFFIIHFLIICNWIIDQRRRHENYKTADRSSDMRFDVYDLKKTPGGRFGSILPKGEKDPETVKTSRIGKHFFPWNLWGISNYFRELDRVSC